MRIMEIPSFPRVAEIDDLEHLYKTRLGQKPEHQAVVAIPLLGYMGWPNDPAAREHAMKMLHAWLDGEEPHEFLKQIPPMHRNWARIADAVNLHHGLSEGGHQQRRGGASVGKAIFLGSEMTKARGASQANLWGGWSHYKDAAHLIAAAITVCADMQRRNRRKPLGIGFQNLLPVRVVCLVPELVIGVALYYQEYGLDCASMGGAEPMFDPETLWRIPENVGIEQVLPPPREILPDEVTILNTRRAGNRGRANGLKTTPVFRP
jgi:hypothetical protein